MIFLRYLFYVVYVLLLLAAPVCVRAMEFDADYVPLNIQQDFDNYLTHISANTINHAQVIKDLQAVLRHMDKPTTDEIAKDRQRWDLFGSLVFEHIRKEIRMSAQLSIAAHYSAIGNKQKAFESLPSTRHMEEYYMGSTGATMLTDFMSALSAYHKSLDRIVDVINGAKYGYDERIQVLVEMIQSFACVQRCLHYMPYDCKNRRQWTEVSEYPVVNFMLSDALLLWPVYGMEKVDNTDSEYIEVFLFRILLATQNGISDVIKMYLESLHDDDGNMLYLVRFVLDYVRESSNEQLSVLSKYSILHCLSEQGYAPATVELGLLTEAGRFNNLRPYDAKTTDLVDYESVYKYYLRGAAQGSASGKMLHARFKYYGIECEEDKFYALMTLKRLADHDDFPKYGAFVYASLLLDNVDGTEYEPVMLYELLCQAAQSSYDENERQAARKIIESTYEEYFK